MIGAGSSSAVIRVGAVLGGQRDGALQQHFDISISCTGKNGCSSFFASLD